MKFENEKNALTSAITQEDFDESSLEQEENFISQQNSDKLRTLFSESSYTKIENQQELQKTFNQFIQTELNSEQLAAVTADKGSFLVIAGAGSGKTRVITARITNLILNHNVEPSNIVALTFTNKAAQEMQHRIEHFLPNLRTKPNIATFHAYCLKLLKKQQFITKEHAFSVIDSQDAQKLLLSIVRDRGLEKLFNAKQLPSMFSTLKMNNLLGIDGPEWNMHHLQQFMELYNAYEKQKQISNYLDFDDLLYKTFKLFKTNETFKTYHLKKHRHVLVDEYQDTNIIQHELLKQMTMQNNKLFIDSVCAVGDEDQSIYSWRGATVKNILEFTQEFQNTQTIKLEQNYRSTQQILDIANHVIAHNVDRNCKKLWSSNPYKHQPLLLECLSDLQEAYSIAHVIHLIAQTEKKSSIAILYRTHYQSRIIEEALIKENIAYTIIGGIQFYERKEIKDLLAYLRLVINPFDRISFFRAINCPLRGLGEKFEELFLQTWNNNPFSTFKEISKILIDDQLVATKQKASLLSFLKTFDDIIQENNSYPLVTPIIEQIIKSIDYIGYLQNDYDKAEAETKRENVAEFLRAAHYFDENAKTGLSQFLDEISLMQEQMKKEDFEVDRISLMTLHSAKGLEFKNVILTGLEEGILPSNQSIGQENVEEERRLFYVGITRAQKKLLITYSKYRNVYGKMDEQRPSRFLQEIPQKLIMLQQAKNWSKASFTLFFKDWLQNTRTIIKSTQPTEDSQVIQVKKHTYEATDATTNSIKTNNQTIKRLQVVKHKIFGIGIANHIEHKGDKTIVTVHFAHHGSKKIDSSFLENI